MVPDSIISITYKFSATHVPGLGHQDSSAAVLLKPTSLTGTSW